MNAKAKGYSPRDGAAATDMVPRYAITTYTR